MSNWDVLTGTPDGLNVVGIPSVGYVVVREFSAAVVVLAQWDDMSTGDNWAANWHVVYKLGGVVVRDHSLFNKFTDNYPWFTYTSDSAGLVCDRVEFRCDISSGSGAVLTARDFEVCT
jgi:hypothetical protein